MPPLASSVALTLVAASGLFLVLLGFTALLFPRRAKAFLLGFAATRRRHHIELVARSVAGLAFMSAAPRLPWPLAFFVAGAVLVATTVVLALLPYDVHKAFARRSVPKALAHLPWLGLASLAAGSLVLWAVRDAGVV